MADIQNYLNNIKNALFGRDVRSSIHDGIDAINKEVQVLFNTCLESFKSIIIDEKKYAKLEVKNDI